MIERVPASICTYNKIAYNKTESEEPMVFDASVVNSQLINVQCVFPIEGRT